MVVKVLFNRFISYPPLFPIGTVLEVEQLTNDVFCYYAKDGYRWYFLKNEIEIINIKTGEI